MSDVKSFLLTICVILFGAGVYLLFKYHSARVFGLAAGYTVCIYLGELLFKFLAR